MDGLHTVSPPDMEPARGNMSLDEAVKSAVRSTPGVDGFSPKSEADDNGASELLDAVEQDANPELPDADDGTSDASKRSVVDPKPSRDAETSALLQAPNRWSKDKRDEFQTLPENAKRIVLARVNEIEAGLTKSTQENADHRRFSENVRSSFTTEHREQLRSAGIDEAGAIQHFLKLHDFSRRDPVGYAKMIISESGLTQDQIFGSQPVNQQHQGQSDESQEDEWVDPHVKTLREKHDATLQELQQIKGAVGHLFQNHQQREKAALEHEIEVFSTAQDADGNPSFPHLESALEEMVDLLTHHPSLKASNLPVRHRLEKAYEMAIHLNPEVRQSIMDAERAKWMSARDSEKAVARAKTAATVKGSPGAMGSGVTAKKMNLDEAVRAGFRQVRNS